MRVKQVFEHYQRIAQSVGEFRLCPFCGAHLARVGSGGRLRAACTGCGFVQHRNPAPAVSILIVDGANVLLGKRRGEPGQGAWSLPSGYIEFEEDFLTAAMREAKEETGLDVAITSILNVVSSFISPQFHFLGVYVAAQVVGGALAAGDDLDAVTWFPAAGPLPEMGFEEDMRIIELHRCGFVGIPVDDEHARCAE